MERKHLIALAVIAVTMTGAAIYSRMTAKPVAAEEVAPTPEVSIALKMSISGERTFARLSEILEAADLMDSAPETPGGVFALLSSPPLGLAARVPSDAPVVGLARMEESALGWAFATNVRSEGLELTGQGPGESQWVAHPPRSGRPSAAVKGDVAFGGKRERVAAMVEVLEARLEESTPPGLRIEVAEVTLRTYAELARALVTRAADVFREGIDELEAARGRAPERGDPRVLISALSEFTSEILGAVARSTGARAILDEQDALSLEIDLPPEVMAAHFSPAHPYVPMPIREDAILAFGGPSPSVETLRQFIGERMSGESLTSLSEALETSSRDSAAFAMGLQSRKPWFELMGQGAPTTQPEALDAPFANELLGALVGCQPEGVEGTDPAAGDEPQEEEQGAPCEAGFRSWSSSSAGFRLGTAAHRLSLGTTGVPLERLALEAREGETLIGGGLIRLGQLNRLIALFSGEVWELLRTRTKEPLRIVVARREDGVVLRLEGTSAAFGPLAALLAELLG